MKLSGEELRKIRDSLRQAFPARTEQLDLVVADADIGIDFAEYTGPYANRIQTLLEYAVGQHQLTKLLKAAVEAAPNNPELSEIAEFVGEYFCFLPRLLTDRDNKDVLGNAERVLFKNVGFQNVRDWLEKLDRLTRVVCRIEPQPRAEGIEGYGTGFLVGPDVILTNDHVASGPDGKTGFWGRPDRAARVRVRFDCEYTVEGKISDGKEFKLAADFQVLRSPGDQLDFALLRLDGSTGRPADDIASGKPRGFVVPASYSFEEAEPLLILQHPKAEPMKLAFGSLTPKKQWTQNRIAYSVNTDGGSSGSPCLTHDLTVGALHHWGSQDYNRGVLMSAILAHWNQPENRSHLLAARLGHLVGTKESVRSSERQSHVTSVQAEMFDFATVSKDAQLQSLAQDLNLTVRANSGNPVLLPERDRPKAQWLLRIPSTVLVLLMLGLLVTASTLGGCWYFSHNPPSYSGSLSDYLDLRDQSGQPDSEGRASFFKSHSPRRISWEAYTVRKTTHGYVVQPNERDLREVILVVGGDYTPIIPDKRPILFTGVVRGDVPGGRLSVEADSAPEIKTAR